MWMSVDGISRYPFLQDWTGSGLGKVGTPEEALASS